jgi:hypothetical protein
MDATSVGPGRAWRVAVRLALAVFAVALAGTWAALFSGGMGGVTAWILLLSLWPLAGIIVLLGAAAISLRRRRVSRAAACGLALGLITLWPGAWNFGLLRIAYPASVEDTRPAATVRLPSDLALRVAWGGDRLDCNQHAFTPDQRWAYDLVVEPAFTGSARPEDYGCWGTPVLAPLAARVHAAHDGEPDAAPGRLTQNVTRPLGNHVALILDTGTYLVLAHLKQGSVAVRAGEVVREGQPIGLCGNSGNTSEPHIHIHHQRQDPVEFPVNFAEGLPLFFRGHDGPPMPEGGIAIEGGRVTPLGAVVRHLGAAPG